MDEKNISETEKELIGYIQKLLSENHTKDDIKKALLEVGWPEDYVASILENTEKPLMQPADSAPADLKTYETEFDKIVDLAKEKGSIKVSALAKHLGADKKNIEEWATILEEHNLVKIYYPLIGEAEVRKTDYKPPKKPKRQPKKDKPKKDKPKKTANRPLCVSIIAVLFFISGGFSLIYSLFLMIQGGMGAASASAVPIGGPIIAEMIKGFYIFIVFIQVLVGAFSILIGLGLWNLKNWARITAIVLHAIGMLTIIMIPISILIIYLLSKKSTKQAFMEVR